MKRTNSKKNNSKRTNSKRKNKLTLLLLAVLSALCLYFLESIISEGPSGLGNLGDSDFAITSPIKEDEALASLHVMDVGQGSSLLLESDGKYALVDGGDRGASRKVVAYLKKEGVKSLEYVIATHYDADHINGLVGCLNVFDVQTVIGPDYEADTRVYRSMMNFIKEQNIPLIHPSVGDEFSLGELTMRVVAPVGNQYQDLNEASIGLSIHCKKSAILVCGDAGSVSEEEMIGTNQPIDSDLYIVNHHGSDGSSSEDFLEKVTPSISVISCGKENSYGHPHREVLERLKDSDSLIYRTDEQGDLVFLLDGKGFYLKEKGNK